MIKLVLIFTLISNIAFGEEMIKLEKDQKAPFPGYLSSESTMEKIKEDLIEGEAARSREPSYKKSIELYKENETYYQNKVNILSVQNDKLAVRLYESTSISTLEKIGWFSLGVIATGIAVYGASQINK